jgi:glycosyltransferase involved in cell wall biosynthesis
MRNKLKNLPDVDIIFLSAFDHNEQTDNHGLFQMFKFFREHIDNKSIFVNMMSSLFRNDVDVFNISHLGGNLTLSDQVGLDPQNTYNPLKWSTFFGDGAEEKYRKVASSTIINNLPDHKFIIIGDKLDINLLILEPIMKHFSSKLLIISGVNNTWTGFCSYPEEFKCEKFKTKAGCDIECPALKNIEQCPQAKGVDPKFVVSNYSITKEFVNRNADSVSLNIGSSYSLVESSESDIFKDVNKLLIPLKSIDVTVDFDELWEDKQANRNKILNQIREQGNTQANYLIMWSAHSALIKRKGFDIFIDALRVLKNSLGNKFNEICLILCARHTEKYIPILKDLQVNYYDTGFVDTDTYNFLVSSCDVFCSTTISDAGPRTTYESAASATPLISFDNCNATDIVNKDNGALVKTYDSESFAREICRFFNYDCEQRRAASLSMFKDYKRLMSTATLVKKWKDYFDES